MVRIKLNPNHLTLPEVFKAREKKEESRSLAFPPTTEVEVVGLHANFFMKARFFVK